MTTGIPKGELIRLTLGGTKIGHSTSSGISISMATEETATKDSGGGKYATNVAGKRSWSGSCEGLLNFSDNLNGDAVLTYEDLFNAIDDGDPIQIAWSTGVIGDKEFQGMALVTSLEQTAPNDENSTYSISLTGTGAISLVEITA